MFFQRTTVLGDVMLSSSLHGCLKTRGTHELTQSHTYLHIKETKMFALSCVCVDYEGPSTLVMSIYLCHFMNPWDENDVTPIFIVKVLEL